GHRPRRSEDQGTALASAERRERSDSRDQPERRRRSHGHLSRTVAQAARRQGDADRDGRAGRQRPRIRPRSHDAQGARGPARSVPATYDPVVPHTFPLPAAIVLVLAGAVACFAGYRLFRVILAIYGFILGAMLASSLMGITNTSGMIVAALVGGLTGALLLTFAYYVAIGILGAGMAVGLLTVFWPYMTHTEPS